MRHYGLMGGALMTKYRYLWSFAKYDQEIAGTPLKYQQFFEHISKRPQVSLTLS